MQQILFFKELDLRLGEIQAILDEPGLDQVGALENHRRLLRQRAEWLTRLLQTIDKTIKRLFGFYSTATIGHAGHVVPKNSV